MSLEKHNFFLQADKKKYIYIFKVFFNSHAKNISINAYGKQTCATCGVYEGKYTGLAEITHVAHIFFPQMGMSVPFWCVLSLSSENEWNVDVLYIYFRVSNTVSLALGWSWMTSWSF